MNSETSGRPKNWIHWLPATVVVVIVFASFLRTWEPETGFSQLIRFGDRFSERAVPTLETARPYVYEDSYGYDAQFYAQMAFDPLLRDEATAAAMDAPNYRFRRILMSAVAWLGGGGQPFWILQVYAGINLIAWFACAWLLLAWLKPTTFEGFLRWSGCILGLGAMTSLTIAMPDLPAMAFTLLALRWWERGRERSSALALGLGILCKETAVISGVLRLDGWGGGWRTWRARLQYGALALLPFALWMLYLATRLNPLSSGSPNNFELPFLAFWGEWKEALSFARDGHIFNLVALVSLLFQAIGLMLFPRPKSAFWRIGAIHLVLLSVLGLSVWEGDPGAAYRVLIPLAFAFNLSLPRDTRWRWPFMVVGNFSTLIGLDYLLRYWG